MERVELAQSLKSAARLLGTGDIQLAWVDRHSLFILTTESSTIFRWCSNKWKKVNTNDETMVYIPTNVDLIVSGSVRGV